MGRFLVRLLAVIGFLTLVGIALLGVGLWYLVRSPGTAADSVVLTIDFRQPLADAEPPGALAGLLGDRRPTLEEVVEALDRATFDPRVKAVVGVFGNESFGLPAAQEVRDALARFRESGKATYAYADSFGEFGPANAAYYLASGFGQVWMRDVGTVGLTGIRLEVPFGREALDSIGVMPEFFRRGDYKSFPESFTRTGFSDASREMMESLASDLYGQLVAGIAEGRGLSPADIPRLIDHAPWLGEEAQAAGLLDRIGDGEALRQAVAKMAGEGADTIDVDDYLEVAPSPAGPPAATIALIRAAGTIVAGDGEGQPLGAGVVMAADAIAQAVGTAADDPAIGAIVLRIDSPGGSAVASEVIGAAVRRAAAAKPVIVSMGATAASGGYWIAAGATRIIAQPATLTGSIGVFAGKFAAGPLWDQLGIDWGVVQRGENADLWSINAPYDAAGEERVAALVDALYERFVALVAAGRGLDPAAVERLAEGRVWTGAQAMENGLVDGLGGLDAAFAAAREALDLPADARLETRRLPESEGGLSEIARALWGGAALGQALGLPADSPLLSLASTALLSPEQRLLHMPPIAINP